MWCDRDTGQCPRVKVDVTVPYLTCKNTWAIDRHPLNDRGDESSTVQKMDSIWQVGIVGAGKGPWLMGKENDVISSNAEWYAMHWATRNEALRRCYEKDAQKVNEAVQSSVSRGAQECTIFTRRTWGI